MSAAHPTPPMMPSIGLKYGGMSLPRPLTRMIARDQELAAAVALVRDPAVQLLTLTGPGGVGKTRLAIAAATEVTADFNDGVVFVDLTPVADSNLVMDAIAGALGLRDLGGGAPQERLLTLLTGRSLLLVLDNFEQVVVAGPRLHDLLSACPGLTLLVTSRTSLRLTGEREFRVAPLSLETKGSDEDLEMSGAVRLFAERAQAIRPEFCLTPETMPAVAEIVGRVDGLPLAIELAASRVKALPLAALLQRLDRRLPLLSGGARDLPLRQQTMHDTIAWSYDLLCHADQALFRRFGVFDGGFTLAAAEAIGTDATGAAGGLVPTTPFGLVEGITSLVDHSLLQQSTGPRDEPRYRMLETVREYALDRLDASGETGAVHRRHAAYFMEFAEGAGWALDRIHTAEWINQLEADYDNLRAALGRLEHAADPQAFLRLARSLVVYWIFRGPHAEGRAWLERALAQGGEISALLRRQALYGLGVLAVNQDDVSRAEACFNECMAIAKDHEDTAGTAYGRFGLGLSAMHLSQFGQATTHLEEALAMARRLDDQALAPLRAGLALSFLGACSYAQDRLPQATACFEAALREQRGIDDHWGVGLSLVGLGYSTRDMGDFAEAMNLFNQGLEPLAELGDHRMIALALDGIAGIAIGWKHPELAARLFGAAAAMREIDGLPVEPAFRASHASGVDAARDALGDDAFGAGWAQGAALPQSTAVANATAIVTLAPGSVPMSPPSTQVDWLGLTPRETEVLRLLAEGLTDRDIAAALSISERTAGNHVQHAMHKVGVDSRTAAAVFAVRHNLD